MEGRDPSLWRPAADRELLIQRARLLQRIRRFFATREVLEVETPVLSSAAAGEPHLHSFDTPYHGPGAPASGRLFLHTSPEFPMKRLLAAGSGPIFQLCKVFRDGEAGRRHNPEFTLLEWYRPGLDHHALMDEVEALLRAVALGDPPAPAERLSYREAFQRYAGIDPFVALEHLKVHAASYAPPASDGESDIDYWRDLILVHEVEPQLGRERPCFVHHYPSTQASLARLDPTDASVAERFELYWRGLELANGFNELADAAEQAQRFKVDRQRRESLGLPPVPVDTRLLAALESGLPPCAGVALGVDRLLMALTGVDDIRRVLAFPIDRA
ncbi:MAG: EF-P lysine aminoacylase GenX [Proteobacteria bacterium]|nr:MAG: EF-P lysine aminoacylase GenX [Pseudomonadota bacterium]